jgi:malate dehydrogenase
MLTVQTTPATTFSDEERNALTVRIQNGGTEVVEAKAGTVRHPL